MHVNEKKSEIRWNSKQADIKKNRYLETHPLGIVYGKVRAAKKIHSMKSFIFNKVVPFTLFMSLRVFAVRCFAAIRKRE